MSGTFPRFLLALSLGGSKDFPWDSPAIIAMFGLSVVFLVLFIWREARAAGGLHPVTLSADFE